MNRNQTKMVQVLFLIVIGCVEPFERKRNRQHDFCEYRQGDTKCISSPANEQLCTGAHNRCTVTKMINLSENVARMRKRHRGVLLNFDLSRVVFEAVIRCEIYWLRLQSFQLNVLQNFINYARWMHMETLFIGNFQVRSILFSYLCIR